MALPEASTVEAMPVFTVLIPQYSEKILLSLKEIIRERQDCDYGITLLDYLKTLFPHEWTNFVEESRMMVQEQERRDPEDPIFNVNNRKPMDVPLKSIGFQKFGHDEVLRTRIWASLRSQTLFVCSDWQMNSQGCCVSSEPFPASTTTRMLWLYYRRLKRMTAAMKLPEPLIPSPWLLANSRSSYRCRGCVRLFFHRHSIKVPETHCGRTRKRGDSVSFLSTPPNRVHVRGTLRHPPFAFLVIQNWWKKLL